MGSVVLGNEYELKRQAYEAIHPLGKTKVDECIDNIYNFVQNNNITYFMLLCRERNDYTIFNFKDKDMKDYFKDAIKDCIYNRGKPVDIGLAEDGAAFELWLKFPNEDNRVHCYYFFPCDNCIIEIKEEDQ